MTARLRLVPIYGAASGRHYLVLDRMEGDASQEQIDKVGAHLRSVAPEAIPLVFAQEVYIPQEDGEEATPEAPEVTVTVSPMDTAQTVEREVSRVLRQHGRALVRYA